jgi:surface antigen
MMKFADVLIQKRWFFIEASIVIAIVFLISLLAPSLQARSISISEQAKAATTDQGGQQTDDSPNAVTNMLFQMTGDVEQASHGVGLRMFSGVVKVSATTARFDKDIVHGTAEATYMTFRAIGTGVDFTFRGIALGVSTTAHGVGHGFSFMGNMFDKAFGFVSKLTHVSSLIRPKDNTPTPTITQARAEQATIIQSGTENVTVQSASIGQGGACDAGEGNGGYPLSWCSAPMDSMATVPYTSDRINRECTSYAYWYFTSVEGHTTFQASGDAKYWAITSNYPTNPLPAVGAIAVETAGAYGHVAIVQALPGQQYAGQVVPAGYVLVSEMNYDWNGHFRYSYSPLSKFSAYIYP